MIARWTFSTRADLPPVELTWHHGGRRPAIWKEANLPDWSLAVLFVGSNGMLMTEIEVIPPRFELHPKEKFADFEPPAQTIPRSIGHANEWLLACKTGKPTNLSNASTGVGGRCSSREMFVMSRNKRMQRTLAIGLTLVGCLQTVASFAQVNDKAWKDGQAAQSVRHSAIDRANAAGLKQVKGPRDYLRADERDVEKWREMKFGLFIHWGPVSILGEPIGSSRKVRGLCSNCGKIDVVWWDGLGGTAKNWDMHNLFRMIRQLAPDNSTRSNLLRCSTENDYLGGNRGFPKAVFRRALSCVVGRP